MPDPDLTAQIGASYRFIRQQRSTAIFQHHVTVFEHIATVGQLERLVGILLDEENRHAFLTQLLNGVEDLLDDNRGH